MMIQPVPVHLYDIRLQGFHHMNKPHMYVVVTSRITNIRLEFHNAFLGFHFCF